MATTNVSIRLGVEGKAEVKRAFDEVGKAGQDAFRGVATSMDAAGAAADREAQRLQRLAQAARQAGAAEQAQRSFNAVLGVGTGVPKSARDSAAVFEDAARAAEDLAARSATLRAQIDPLGAAQKKLNAEIANANALYKAGAITAKEQAAAQALAQQRFESTARSLGAVGGQSRLTASQFTNLSYQLNDVFVSLASGQRPLMVLIQQGSQIAQVMGPVGVTGTLKGVAQALGAILTPARLAIGAIVGAAVASALAFDSFIRQQKQVEVALLSSGRIAGATLGDINRIAEAGAAAGRVSVAAARDMAIAFLRTGQIGKEHFAGLIAVAKDYAATIGTDLDTAVKTLAEAFADPLRGSETLNNQLRFLDDRTRSYIRSLVEQNDRSAAQRMLLDAMRGSLATAETATTGLARAWDFVKRAASGAYEALGRVVDRATGMQPAADKIQEVESRIAAWQQVIEQNKEYEESLRKAGTSEQQLAGIIPVLKTAREELVRLNRELNELKRLSADARAQADLGRIEAEARELSRRVGDVVRDIVPGTETIRQLEALRSSLGQLLEDPLAARHAGNLRQVEDAYRRVTQALGSYAGQNIRFIDPMERKLRLQQIEIALTSAATPAQKAALEAERARIELIGQSVTPAQAALAVQQARQRVVAETSRYMRDYARDQKFAIEQTQAEIAFIGRSIEEKDKFLARLKAEQDLRRQGIAAASAEGQLILVNAERQAVLNAQLDRARDLMQGWQSVFDSAMNRFADLLTQGKRDWQSWLDAGRTAITDIHRELLKLAILNPLKNLLFGTNAATLGNAGGLFGSLFGSGTMAAGPVAAAANLFGSPIYHLGGVAGDAAPLRRVPASVFAGAPRLHEGAFLKPDEVPAILQRGERVLSREETRRYAEHGSGIHPVINVVIQTPNPAAFQASRTQIAADLARAVRMGRRGL